MDVRMASRAPNAFQDRVDAVFGSLQSSATRQDGEGASWALHSEQVCLYLLSVSLNPFLAASASQTAP